MSVANGKDQSMGSDHEELTFGSSLILQVHRLRSKVAFIIKIPGRRKSMASSCRANARSFGHLRTTGTSATREGAGERPIIGKEV